MNELKTVLVVDDAPANLSIIVELLENEFRTRIATTGHKALEIIHSETPPDLVLLDVGLPDLDGYEVCAQVKANPDRCNIPVIFLTSRGEQEDELRGFEVGAVDYVTKPVNPPLLQSRVRTHLMLLEAQRMLSGQNRLLEQRVRERTQDIAMLQEATFIALGSLAETRDNETGNHIRRTQNYVRCLAAYLQKHGYADVLDDATVANLYRSACLHDIGKVGIPDSILLKPGKLTPEEFAVMKTHTTLGREAIAAADEYLGTRSEFLQMAGEIAHCHHEKWDGSGYPRGLQGTDIPLSARLMALADVYDALISKRVYKEAFSHERAVAIILEGRGTHFDPAVVDAFEVLNPDFHAQALRFSDPRNRTLKEVRKEETSLDPLRWLAPVRQKSSP